jgi:prevent-host-death family protein
MDYPLAFAVLEPPSILKPSMECRGECRGNTRVRGLKHLSLARYRFLYTTQKTGHNVVMKRSNNKESERVSIANFKAKLSYYLRKVRLGEEVIVTEHRRPVARICQLEAEGLEIVRAKGSFAEVAETNFEPINGVKVDSLSHLLKERSNR